jgi:hypothetical protein
MTASALSAAATATLSSSHHEKEFIHDQLY